MTKNDRKKLKEFRVKTEEFNADGLPVFRIELDGFNEAGEPVTVSREVDFPELADVALNARESALAGILVAALMKGAPKGAPITHPLGDALPGDSGALNAGLYL